MNISSVSRDQVETVWSHSRKMIMKGLAMGQGDASTEEEFISELKCGKMQMWAVDDGENIKAVVIVSVDQFPTIKKVTVNLIAGEDLPQWSDLVQQTLLDLKNMVGASCVEASCRLGMAKFLAGCGWSKKAIIMELK